MLDTERAVLQQIMQVLGPSAVCECSGCAWETNEAIRLLNTIGIEYKPRGEKRMQHNIEAERRGNEENTLVPALRTLRETVDKLDGQAFSIDCEVQVKAVITAEHMGHVVEAARALLALTKETTDDSKATG